MVFWLRIAPWKGLRYTSSTSFMCMFPHSPEYVKGDRARAGDMKNIDLGYKDLEYIDLDVAWVR